MLHQLKTNQFRVVYLCDSTLKTKAKCFSTYREAIMFKDSIKSSFKMLVQ